MIQTETVTINNRQFLHTWSDADMKIIRDGVEYDEAYDPVDTGRVYTETQHLIETVTEDIEELREKYSALAERFNLAERRAERLERIKTRVEALRDAALLQTTKAIYQAVLELFEED